MFIFIVYLDILVITDGVVAMPDSNVMESLLYQLHYDSISLSFLKVGSSFHPHSSAGYVSYTDLLHFLSHTTSGAYLEKFPIFVREFCCYLCWLSSFRFLLEN